MMNKLVLFLLVGFALISLSAGNEGDNELVETESTGMMELENMETLELAEPEAISKKKKGKKRNKKRRNKKNKKKGNNKNKKKGNKKNKKKGNKKNKKKRNKKNTKKGNKKNKNNGKRKNKNNRKKGNKNKGKSRSSKATNTECVKKINTYLYYYAKQVINLDKQLKRAHNHNETAFKKAGKKGDFLNATNAAQSAGGGNMTAPKCGTNSTNSGAKKLKSILKHLNACSENIKNACKMPATPNKTELAACRQKVKEYTWKMGNNTNKTDLCKAFQDADTQKKYTAVKACVTTKMTGNNMTLKDWQLKVTATKKNCIKAFSECRKQEREVGPSIQTCSKTNATILKSLNAITANKNSTTKVKAKVTNLTKSSGRHNRAAPTTCAAVVVVVQTFTTKLRQNPAADVTTETNDISGITLANGKCSTTNDLIALGTTLDKIITDLAAKISILQEELKTLTGSYASSSEIAAATTASSTSGTTASGRRRRASLLKMLNKVNMD